MEDVATPAPACKIHLRSRFENRWTRKFFFLATRMHVANSNPLLNPLRACNALINFCMSSVACFLVDNVAFTVVLYAVGRSTEWKRATAVFVAMVTARAISATTNYVFNRKLVFASNASKVRSFLKYWLLVLSILAAGYLSTAVLSRIFDARGFFITIVKIAVETGLFFISYKVQRHWIFRDAAEREKPHRDPT